MAVPSQQIGWSEESKLLWYILKELDKLQGGLGSIAVPTLQQVIQAGSSSNLPATWTSGGEHNVSLDPDTGSVVFDGYLFTNWEDIQYLDQSLTQQWNLYKNQIARITDIYGLKPIVIQDWYQEYFTDITSALQCISDFGFPTPIWYYYDNDSKSFFFLYTSSYLENIFVNYNSSTELAFGYNNRVTIQDEAGFIYGFSGNAFQNNQKHEYSKTNILKVGGFSNEFALRGSQTDFIIEQCYCGGGGFAYNSTGKIKIQIGDFDSDGNFTLALNVEIDTLLSISTYFGYQLPLNAKFKINNIPSIISYDSNMFNTSEIVHIYLPITYNSSATTSSAFYTQIVSNVTNSNSIITIQ